MLDFNHKTTIAERVNDAIDAALVHENSTRVSRDYLGGSRVGHACERALQFEFAGASKDEGSDFSGRTLRIFGIGHALEDLAIQWLRAAGLDLYTRKGNKPDGEQFGFSAMNGLLQGHIDGVIVAGPDGFKYPALWENKCLGSKSWRDLEKNKLAVSKPIYHAQVVLYQAYLELHENPALFTAINADTMEIYAELVPFDAALAQRMSDRAIKVITAAQAGEQLNRAYQDPTHFECRMCSWQDRCWRNTK